MDPKVCCFSGYRPDKLPFACDKADPAYNAFENTLFNQILGLIEEGYTVFYSGMAEGFDIIASELVLAAKAFSPQAILQLICVVPFRGQTAGWDRAWQDRYQSVLEEADEVVVLSEHFYRNCYEDRNRYLIDHSDLLLTYYDALAGGIQRTVDYAARQGIQVYNIATPAGSGPEGAPVYTVWKDAEEAPV